MFALFIVLNDTDYLDEVLSRFVSIGVGGATIIDSQGMARAIVHNNFESIPLFGSLKSMLTDSHPYSKTIFTVLSSQELVDKTVAEVQHTLSDIKRKDIGFMFTIPVAQIFPIKKA
jgi:nitrogen regulatory protein PII